MAHPFTRFLHQSHFLAQAFTPSITRAKILFTKKYAELNRLSYSFPIYVGKAVPKGI
jgi:hypothetical protein